MTKDRREIDFYVTRNEEPFLMVEVKWADSGPTGNFSIFGKYFPGVKKVQIVGKLDREKTYKDGTEIRAAHNWLANLTLS